MRTFFRIQEKGISFEDMQKYISASGGDDMEHTGGICAAGSVTELLFNTAMDAYDDSDGEVVVFTGYVLAEIYDGYRVEPIQELARFAPSEFEQRADEIAEKFE